MLEVNHERNDCKHDTDDTKPDPAVDEIGVRAQTKPGKEGSVFNLALAVHDVCCP